jgi:hypothetical protein
MDDSMISHPTVRERGWTDAMIRDLLGEPDATRTNPIYRSAPPARFYSLIRVQAAEAEEKFTQRRDAAAKRSATSSAAAERKRQELLEGIAPIPSPAVAVLPMAELIQRACDAYNDYQSANRREYDWASPRSRPDFLDRIMVNYLRHELTPYEKRLYEVAGRVGVRDAEQMIRESVYDAIAGAYPHLQNECGRQSATREGWI